jgi:FXSXX-COOH protein
VLGAVPSDIESGDIESDFVDVSGADLADLVCANYPTDSALGRSLRRIFAAAENPDEDMAGFNNQL